MRGEVREEGGREPGKGVGVGKRMGVGKKESREEKSEAGRGEPTGAS